MYGVGEFFRAEKTPGTVLVPGGAVCRKASQSLRRKAQIESESIFDRGVYLGKNTSQAASVEFVCQRQTNYARSRL